MANLAYVWGKYEQNVIEYEREWYMLSFSWKWYGEKTTRVLGLPDFPLWKKDKKNDRELVTRLWKLFDDADIVIAHNGKSFDVKKANARFIYHGMKRPSPYSIIDTKIVAKRYFNFNSNKLDDLGNYLGLGRKIDTGGFELWLGCAKGDENSWVLMKRYNKQDVVLLEKVYEKLRGWIENHPPREFGCPNCGGWVQKRGFSVLRSGRKRQRLHCQECGAWTNGVLLPLAKK